MTHAAVVVQRTDGFDESLGDQNPCAWECEGKRKVKEKTHLKFEQSDEWFFAITKSPLTEKNKDWSGGKESESGIGQFEFKVYKEQQMDVCGGARRRIWIGDLGDTEIWTSAGQQ